MMRRRATVASVLIALVTLPFAGCGGASTPSDRGGPAADAIVGAWHAKIQFKDGAFAAVKNLEFLYVFNAGGTMTESSNYDGAPPVPPAYGVWRMVGPRQAEATYTYFNTQPPSRFEDVARGGGWLPAGRGVLRERFTLGADAQSLESAITLELYDQHGNRITGGGAGTGAGTRIRFDGAAK
jgi:hypothetical protein